jgi:hypothetical protein
MAGSLMWLELTDALGHRTLVNLDLVVSIKDADNGSTILETAAQLSGALHVIVVRESLDEIARLMEGMGEGPAIPGRAVQDPDFVSDGHEG